MLSQYGAVEACPIACEQAKYEGWLAGTAKRLGGPENCNNYEPHSAEWLAFRRGYTEALTQHSGDVYH